MKRFKGQEPRASPTIPLTPPAKTKDATTRQPKPQPERDFRVRSSKIHSHFPVIPTEPERSDGAVEGPSGGDFDVEILTSHPPDNP